MEVDSTNYKKYHTNNKLKKLMIRRFETKLLKLLSNEDNSVTLLDAGCGEGFILDKIYNNTKIRYITGYDINDESLAFAKANNKKINYLNKDIYNINSVKQYDITLALEVLEHLENPKKALKKLVSITKKKLIISVPNEPYFSLGNLLSLKNVTRLGNPIDHINKWTKSKFIKFLKENKINNFNVVSSFPWTIVTINI